MSTVKWDTVDGARASISYQGWEIERRCLVTGLDKTPDILIQAVTAALYDAGYAGIGAAYEYLPYTFLEEIHPSLVPGTQDTAQVSLVFRQLVPEMTTDGGTTLSQETSCFDKNGQIVQVTYKGQKQKVQFSKLIPESTISITRLETSSPGATSRQYVGKVNSGGWSRDSGAQPRTWLCAAITGQNRGTGIFLVTYQFAYRSDTWDEKAFYIDPKTGRIPGDVADNDGDAIKTVRKYEEVNFNGLNLGA